MEAEEEARFETGMYAVPKIELDQTMQEIRELAQQIRDKKKIMKVEARIVKQSTKPILPRNTVARGRERTVAGLRKQMEDLGVDMSETEKAHFTRTRSRSKSLRSRSTSEPPAKRARVASTSRGRSVSKPPRDESGVKDVVVSFFFEIKNKLKILLLIIFFYFADES